MELEQQRQGTYVHPAGGPPPDDSMAGTMAEAMSLLAAADKMLDAIHVADHERYIADNRQEGGQ